MHAKNYQPSLDDRYPSQAYQFLFDIEDRHFWFVGRNRIIETLISCTLGKARNISFLEIGCGTGYVLTHLERLGFRVTGLDMHEEALAFSRRRTEAPLVRGDFMQYVPKKLFDAVGAFDVMEHVGNDKIFLRRCLRILAPGGWLFLTVPAGMELWSRYDEACGHKHRYSRGQLVALLEQNGFKVKKATYVGLFQYLPHWFAKKVLFREQIRSTKDLYTYTRQLFQVPHPLINSLLQMSMYVEALFLRWFDLPFGTSVMIAAQRRGKRRNTV